MSYLNNLIINRANSNIYSQNELQAYENIVGFVNQWKQSFNATAHYSYNWISIQTQKSGSRAKGTSIKGKYAIFEIKQELNTEHIKYATQKIQSVRRLKRTSVPIHHAGGTFECKRYHNIIGGLLTTRSAFKDMDGNIEKNLKNLDIEKRIDIICCLNKVSYIIDYLDKKITLNKNKSNEVLIFMFLEFLLRLQKLGTVPAMDFLLYAKAIDSI